MASPSGFELLVLDVSGPKFFFLTLLAGAAGAGALFFAWVNLVRKRVMEDMPTARIRSAPQGYIELQGHAELMDGAPIYAPLSRELCTWYRFKVEHKESESFNNSNNSKWRTIQSATSDDLFYLVDETGKCAVDPEGAKVTTTHKRTWYGQNRTPPKYTEDGFFQQFSGFSQIGKKYRFTEEKIVPGDNLYALGNFTTHGGAGVSFDLKTEVGEILRDWKRDNATMLSRFDANNDGEIDMQEWETARSTAEAEAVQAREHHAVAPPIDVLAKGSNARNPFIITTRTEEEMLKHYHWVSVSTFVIGCLSLITVLWAITIRLSS